MLSFFSLMNRSEGEYLNDASGILNCLRLALRNAYVNQTQILPGFPSCSAEASGLPAFLSVSLFLGLPDAESCFAFCFVILHYVETVSYKNQHQAMRFCFLHAAVAPRWTQRRECSAHITNILILTLLKVIFCKCTVSRTDVCKQNWNRLDMHFQFLFRSNWVFELSNTSHFFITAHTHRPRSPFSWNRSFTKTLTSSSLSSSSSSRLSTIPLQRKHTVRVNRPPERIALLFTRSICSERERRGVERKPTG